MSTFWGSMRREPQGVRFYFDLIDFSKGVYRRIWSVSVSGESDNGIQAWEVE